MLEAVDSPSRAAYHPAIPSAAEVPPWSDAKQDHVTADDVPPELYERATARNNDAPERECGDEDGQIGGDQECR
jgi:hypothetical protein